MSIVLKIAFRNLKEHKTKTFIVGTLIALGIAILVIGNSLMDSATEGIRKTYIESYTGDVIVTGRHRGEITLFGLMGMDGLNSALPVIPEYEVVYDFAVNHPDVIAVNPQVTTVAMMRLDEGETYSFLFGVDPVRYEKMFPDNIELLQGRFLLPHEEGIVISEAVAEQLEKNLGRLPAPGDKLVLTMLNEVVGIKVREVPIRGVFRFRQTDPQMDTVSFIDVGNLRALAGMKLSAVSVDDLTEAERAVFSDFDEDALFGADDGLFGGALIDDVSVTVDSTDDAFSFFEVFERDDEAGLADDSDSDAWHFLLLKLRPGASADKVMADLQQFFAANDLPADTLDWLAGAGPIAGIAYGVKGMFNVVIVVIAIVAVIIIMNTLVISVTERTVEIGTMRALGAQKSFVRRMITWETLLISGIFGVIGIALGCAVLWILGATGIEASNAFFEVIFGGKTLHPVPSVSAIVTSFVVVAVIGVVSALYPASVALKATPAAAMQE